MVKIHATTTDQVTAWRVRDALAAHPLLGGATAQIQVIASTQGIVLDGWALNDQAIQLAVRLACQAAGQRAALLRTTVVPQSEQALEVSRVAYQADRVDFLALIDNHRSLLDARLGYYRALSDRELAMADLARAIGDDVPGLTTGSPAREVK